MKAGRPTGKGKGGHGQPEELSAAATVRRGNADFLSSFVGLQTVVQAACAPCTNWEAKVAAGLRAVLDFCADDPAAGRALTLNSRRQEGVSAGREPELLSYFAGLLTAVTPSERRFEIATDEGVIEAVAVAIRAHLVAGTADQLPTLAPELTYMAILPYAGLAEARRWTEFHAQGEA